MPPSDPTRTAAILAANARSLQILERSLGLNLGQFSLILVRCNYSRLRQMILADIQAASPLAMRELRLSPQTSSLHKAIQGLEGDRPQVLMVTGLESVGHLESLLSGANLVRDEFRKNFSLTLVLWTTDQVFQTLTEVAQDFRSFAAGSIAFKFPVDELIYSLRQYADQIFETLLYAGGDRFLPNSALHLDTASRLRTELEFAVQDIHSSGQELDLELQASIDFLRGRDAQSRLEMDRAKIFYERSLAFWTGQESVQKCDRPSAARERKACLLFHLGCWWRRHARMRRAEYPAALLKAKQYFQDCLAIFREDGRQALIARFITALGQTLQKLEDWQALEAIAREGLSLHQQYDDPLRLAQDYGFLAEVTLARSQRSSAQDLSLAEADWREAKTYAEQALEILDRAEQNAGRTLTQPQMAKAVGQDSQEGIHKTLSKPANQDVLNNTGAGSGDEPSASEPWEEDSLALAEAVHRGWYLLLLSRSLARLGERSAAIGHLEAARRDTHPQADPTLYIHILQALQSLYFAQARYLAAFRMKQQQRIVKQQYGFTAFVGASRLEPLQIASQGELSPSVAEAVVIQEIAASGRQQDVTRLVARVSLPRDKLTVIHGASGVGKSSILAVGLIPALRQKQTIEARQILPVLVSVYNGWVVSLEREMTRELEMLGETPLHSPGFSRVADPPSLIRQLQQNSDRNLYTVLIFDQFEEFFFAYPEVGQRRSFYLFLKDCLNIPYIKVILSLREDYLHYLLEIDRVADLEVINHDILSKQIRYPLGDFTPKDARTVIRSLTARSQFSLEESLVTRLVSDLAGSLGGVRPIELQVVGAQLQDENITTLAEYQKLGDFPKETLVQRSLEGVIQDCGAPNEAIAKVILFLLTTKEETRPLKTQTELTEELTLAKISHTREQLELVLEILVGSGLVLKIPEDPEPLHQLVHDYLVRFIRNPQESDSDLRVQLTAAQVEMASVQAQRDRFAAANRDLDEANQRLDQTNQDLGKANQELDQTRQQERRIRNRTALSAAALLIIATVISTVLVRNAEQDALLAQQKLEDASRETEIAERGRQEAERQAQEASDRLKTANLQRRTAQTEVDRAQRELSAAQANLKQLQQGTAQASTARQQAEARVTTAEIKLSQAEAALYQANAAVRVAQAEQQQARVAQQEALEGTRLERAGTAALQQFQFSQAEALVAAVKAGTALKAIVQSVSAVGRPLDQYPAVSPLLALQTIADNIREQVQVGGDQGRIQAAQFSPKGDRFITAGANGSIRLWDLQGNPLGKPITADASGLRDARFSPNGQAVVILGSSGSVRLWDLQSTPKLLDSPPITSFQLSADNQIVTADTDNTLRIWSLQGEAIASLPQPEGIVSLQISPDRQHLAILGDSGAVKLIDLQSQEVETLANLGATNGSLQFSPNGRYLALSNGKATVSLWNLQTRQVAQIGGQMGNLLSLQFSPDSQYLATAGEEGTLRLWEVGNRFWRAEPFIQMVGRGSEFAVFQGHRGTIRGMQFSPDGQTIITRSDDNTLRLWDLRGNPIALLRGHRGKIESMQFSPNGQTLLTGGADGTARLWNLSGNPIAELPDQQGDYRDRMSLHFSPTSEQLITGGKDGITRLWSLQGSLQRELSDRLRDIQDIQISANGQKIAVLAYGTLGATIRIWDEQGSLLHKYPEPQTNQFNQDNLHDLRLSPDGQVVAVLGDQTTPNGNPAQDIIRLWDLQTNQVRALSQTGILSLQFSPDGQRLATGGTSGTLNLWERQGNLIRSLSGSTSGILDLQFSPDGQRLATGEADGAVRLWDLQNGQGDRPARFTGHRGNVLAVQFSPDGQRLATGGADGTARLWNLQGSQLAEFRGHQGSILSLQFRADGQRIATRSEDGTTRIWSLQGQQIAQYDGYQSALSPNWQQIATVGKAPSKIENDRLSRVRLWQINDLNGLLTRSCNWLKPYLAHAPDLDESDRRICDQAF
ncbi:MAG TPA: hypothetical protein V6C84_30750 [Coleofasciculaceae cyanobacterium]